MSANSEFDSAAIGRLYQAYRELIWRYLLRRTGDRAAADDLLADVFLAAVRGLPRFESRGIPVAHWLYRVATRVARRWRRDCARARRCAAGVVARGGGRHDARGSAPDEQEAETEGRRIDRERVRCALEELPVHQRAIVLLHYHDQLTQREIARLLALREGTVRSRLSRGLARLRRMLAPQAA